MIAPQVDLSALPPTISVEQAAALLGISRSHGYELARSGLFPSPVLRLGRRRLVVPSAPLLEVLGIRRAEPADSEPVDLDGFRARKMAAEPQEDV